MATKTELALGLQYGAPFGEPNWNVWADENWVRIGGTSHISVVNKTTTAPPGTFVEGARYIVATGATGTWSGKDGQLAFAVDGTYQFYAMKTGWMVHDESDNSVKVWNGTAFVEPSAAAIAAAVAAEAAIRAAADSSEATARAAADTTLQTNITNEATARAAADTTLQNNINAEATSRATGDSALESTKQANIQFKDEGVDLGTPGTAIAVDFTGAGVTASRTGDTVTVNVAGGGGGGVTYTGMKSISVGPGGDYTDIGTAMADIGANHAGLILIVTLLGNITSGSPVIASFPSFLYVEFAMGGFDFGSGILAVSGGKDYCALSGNGGTNNNGITLQNLTSPLVGSVGTLTLKQNTTIRDSVLNTLTVADGGAGSLLLQNVTSIDTINTDVALSYLSGSHRVQNVVANYATNPGNAIIANEGSVVSVGSFSNSGVTVTNVYSPAKGIIFGGAPSGNFTTYSSDPVEDFGVVYGNSAWSVPFPLSNSWVTNGAPWSDPSHRKVGTEVQLRGAAKDGTSGVLFTLPAGHRPPYQMSFAVPVHDSVGAATYGHLVIYTNGNVELEHPATLSNHVVWLDGVKFNVN